MASGAPTLYEYAGGRPILRRLAEAQYRHSLKDPILTEVFDSGQPDHADYLADWLSEVFGGPKLYSEKHGDRGGLLHEHAELGITERQRRRFVESFVEAADEVGLSDNPTFRQRLRDYLDWGSRIAVDVSQPDADRGSDEPVPAGEAGPVGPPAG